MEYPNSGSLNKSTVRRSDKSPDFFGSIKVDPTYLKDLIAKSNGLVEIKLSGWNRTSHAGNEFISLAVDTYVKPGAQAAKPEEKLPYE